MATTKQAAPAKKSEGFHLFVLSIQIGTVLYSFIIWIIRYKLNLFLVLLLIIVIHCFTIS